MIAVRDRRDVWVGPSPDPNDSKRAQVRNAQSNYESEMALFYECMPQYAQKVFDSADIVRDGGFTTATRKVIKLRHTLLQQRGGGMEEQGTLASRTLSVIGFGLLGFAITILAGGVWSTLLVTNLRSTPAVPWSVPAMALLLWLIWGYVGGKGWPSSTSDARHHYLRANRRSARTYRWALIAGVLSVVALAGYWIALFRMVKMPPECNSGRVRLSPNNCRFHDYYGFVGCPNDGRGGVSRIFSGSSRT
jgi:hypothetical protein